LLYRWAKPAHYRDNRAAPPLQRAWL